MDFGRVVHGDLVVIQAGTGPESSRTLRTLRTGLLASLGTEGRLERAVARRLGGVGCVGPGGTGCAALAALRRCGAWPVATAGSAGFPAGSVLVPHG